MMTVYVTYDNTIQCKYDFNLIMIDEAVVVFVRMFCSHCDAV